MTDGDPLAVQVRLGEATEHLERARESLAERDEAVATRLDDIIADVETVGATVESPRDDQSRWQEAD